MVKEKINNMNRVKKAQVTIFIIIALIIVVGIALIYTLVKNPKLPINPIEDPNGYMQKCLEDSIIKYEKLFIENNGYINKTDNYILYKNEKVPYLCKASKFYTPCINQEPLFVENIKINFKNYVDKDAKKCFDSLIKNLEKRGYNVKNNNTNFETDLKFIENKIILNIKNNLIITKGEEKLNFNNFIVIQNSPIYNLFTLAEKIVNFESTICEFNSVNWMRYYPEIIISRFITSDQTKIYTLTEEKSKKQIKFAVKTCVLPAGI